MMKWYQYMACFFAGFFLTNAVPHFVHGVSGKYFPSPFGDPPGKGLSSPTINVLWALFNLVISYRLFKIGKLSERNKTALLVFFGGILICSIALSYAFAQNNS